MYIHICVCLCMHAREYVCVFAHLHACVHHGVSMEVRGKISGQESYFHHVSPMD